MKLVAVQQSFSIQWGLFTDSEKKKWRKVYSLGIPLHYTNFVRLREPHVIIIYLTKISKFDGKCISNTILTFLTQSSSKV